MKYDEKTITNTENGKVLKKMDTFYFKTLILFPEKYDENEDEYKIKEETQDKIEKYEEVIENKRREGE